MCAITCNANVLGASAGLLVGIGGLLEAVRPVVPVLVVLVVLTLQNTRTINELFMY